MRGAKFWRLNKANQAALTLSCTCNGLFTMSVLSKESPVLKDSSVQMYEASTPEPRLDRVVSTLFDNNSSGRRKEPRVIQSQSNQTLIFIVLCLDRVILCVQTTNALLVDSQWWYSILIRVPPFRQLQTTHGCFELALKESLFYPKSSVCFSQT